MSIKNWLSTEACQSQSNLYVEWVEGEGEASKDADKNSNAKTGSKPFYPGTHGQAGCVKSLKGREKTGSL